MAKPSTMASSLKKNTGDNKNLPAKSNQQNDLTKTNTSKNTSGKKQKTLEDMFEEELKDIYSAEKQLIEALPKMAEAAYSEELQDAFNHHLQQTKRHAERIEKVFDRMRLEHEEKKCLAMEGLIKEAKEIIDEYEEDIVRDSALIIAAQKVEHYEIASYGSLCELADVLGYGKIRDILHRTLEEEEDTDHHLSMIAQAVNDEAYETSQEEQHENVY
jgi:ferritin-like metal-binding protein YciE